MIAFEATPSKAVRIEQRLREAGIWHKVVLHPIAASNSTGHAPLYIPDGDNGSEMDSVGSTFYYTRDQRTISVQGGRLDDFVHEPVMLLKLDVQGHELQVLAGAERLLTHHGVDMIVLEFAPKLLMANAVDPALLLHFLYDRGYQCFSCPSANPQSTDQDEPPAGSWHRDLDLFDIGFLPNLKSDGSIPLFDPGRFCDLICL